MNDEMDTMLDAVEDEEQIEAPMTDIEEDLETTHEDDDLTLPEDEEDLTETEDADPAEIEESEADTEEEPPKEETTPAKEEAAPAKEEAAPAPDARDLENEQLKKQLAERDRLIRDTLKMLGEDENAGSAGLEKLAAESEGISVEEYRKKRAEEVRAEETKRLARQQAFEEKIRADLKEVQDNFPDAKAYNSVYDLPNSARFRELRDLGLSPREAYAAANPDRSTTRETVARRQSLNETKSHLRSSVPKGSKDTSAHIPRGELERYREMLPDASDSEILNLYKRATKN